MDYEVSRRQQSFWDVRQGSRLVRIHFHGKEEFKFVDSAPRSLAVLDEHPLLIDYQFDWTNLYLAGPVTAPDDLLGKLNQAIESVVDGWRSGADYLNSFGAERILREGSGQLLAAPYPVAEACRAVLRDAHARFSSLPARPARWPRQVLVAGRNYVVARSFRLEDLPD